MHRKRWTLVSLIILADTGACWYFGVAVALHPEDEHEHDDVEVEPLDPDLGEWPLLHAPSPVLYSDGAVVYG